ncbi:MAG: polysaccharide deacetylase family protein [Silvanigrellales bacterium]|nr:polysaccharide deacetylase family protein [Silvanigrellales bacterium]
MSQSKFPSSPKTFFGAGLSTALGAGGCMLLGGLLAAACGGPVEQGAEVQDFTRDQLDGRESDSRGNRLPNKTLALTFDDGLGPRSLELAKYLANEGIQAAFFLNGSNGRTGDMAEIQKLNHIVANHTHNHLDMQASSTAKKSQVVATDSLISPYVTGRIFLFRAPFGSWNGSVADYLNREGLTKYVGSIFWDIGGELSNGYGADWACWGQGVSVRDCGDKYMNEIEDKGRGIVLLHDIHSKTIDMTKYIVPILKQKGYNFVRVDTVPSVAEQVRKAGGTPGAQFTQRKPGAIECPAGYTLKKVGTEGGRICSDGINAWGPFTAGMVAKCLSWGGGPACNSDRCSEKLAISARGTGLCPAGSSFDDATTYCVEGANAFGPFPKALINKCITAGGGTTACNSARWNRNFLKSLL